MTLSAFHGDAALRTDTIDCLRVSHGLGQLVPGPLFWDGSRGSVVGCILRSDNLLQWESALGLPQWLAVSLDALCAVQPTPAAADETAAAVLGAIRPGVDLQRAGSSVVLAVFDQIDRNGGAALPPALQEALGTVGNLHKSILAGDAVNAAQWRAARTSATALADSMSDPSARACAVCVETAAWDPQRSRSVVFDTMRVWSRAVVDRALIDYGWDADEEAALDKLLQSLHERYVVGQPEPRTSAFAVLGEQYPDVHKRLLGKLQLEQHTAETSLSHARDTLLDVLRSA